VSCNPAELKDPLVPPMSSGYPVASRGAADPSSPDYIAETERTHRSMWEDFSAFCREAGAPELTWGAQGPDFIHESPWLNLYVYPSIADYDRERPLAPTWHRLESSVRATAETWELPPHLRADAPDVAPDSGLVYLSLGSLGSADVGLMQRLVDVMGATRHRVIVSKGPLADQITLHDNMTGEGFLPQPAILPMVDVVITHGGNNTVTEAFHHGKPMVVLPLFWDQVDNAQRVDETGFGVRLSTYGFDDAELTGAVDRLLADASLRARMAANARALQVAPGRVKAADLIERVARTGEPVLR
jgi:UDP:flavonoid glycosyltransferase YjiC (YdhE family)